MKTIDPWTKKVRNWLVGRSNVRLVDVLGIALGVEYTLSNQRRCAAVMMALGMRKYVVGGFKVWRRADV